MSRIDDALRRARVPLTEADAREFGSEVFVSVWPELDAPIERAARATARPPRSATTESIPVVAPRRSVAISPVPGTAAEWREKLAVGANSDGVTSEFRRLAASLIQLQRSRPFKTLTVTSALQGDGKTLTALNLATVLSESSRRRVLLVEGDLRRPHMAQALGLRISEGLSEVLKAAEPRPVPRIQLSSNLTLIPAGPPDPDPVSALTSPHMHQLLLAAAEEFDWVIVDTPPTSVASDAELLSALTDATILVVRAGRTPSASVQQAIELIGRERIVGVVLNATPDRAGHSAEYRYADAAGHASTSDRM